MSTHPASDPVSKPSSKPASKPASKRASKRASKSANKEQSSYQCARCSGKVLSGKCCEGCGEVYHWGCEPHANRCHLCASDTSQRIIKLGRRGAVLVSMPAVEPSAAVASGAEGPYDMIDVEEAELARERFEQALRSRVGRAACSFVQRYVNNELFQIHRKTCELQYGACCYETMARVSQRSQPYRDADEMALLCERFFENYDELLRSMIWLPRGGTRRGALCLAPSWLRTAEAALRRLEKVTQDYQNEAKDGDKSEEEEDSKSASGTSLLAALAAAAAARGPLALRRLARRRRLAARALLNVWLEYVELCLRRLQAAGRPDAPALTRRDWAVCDRALRTRTAPMLWLVHSTENSPRCPLMTLVRCVRRYGVERAAPLAERRRRWAAARQHHLRRGLATSLLLLQRRWWELRREARAPRAAPPPVLALMLHRYPQLKSQPMASWQTFVVSGQIVDATEEELENIEPLTDALSTSDDEEYEHYYNTPNDQREDNRITEIGTSSHSTQNQHETQNITTSQESSTEVVTNVMNDMDLDNESISSPKECDDLMQESLSQLSSIDLSKVETSIIFDSDSDDDNNMLMIDDGPVMSDGGNDQSEIVSQIEANKDTSEKSRDRSEEGEGETVENKDSSMDTDKSKDKVEEANGQSAINKDQSDGLTSSKTVMDVDISLDNTVNATNQENESCLHKEISNVQTNEIEVQSNLNQTASITNEPNPEKTLNNEASSNVNTLAQSQEILATVNDDSNPTNNIQLTDVVDGPNLEMNDEITENQLGRSIENSNETIGTTNRRERVMALARKIYNSTFRGYESNQTVGIPTDVVDKIDSSALIKSKTSVADTTEDIDVNIAEVDEAEKEIESLLTEAKGMVLSGEESDGDSSTSEGDSGTSERYSASDGDSRMDSDYSGRGLANSSDTSEDDSSPSTPRPASPEDFDFETDTKLTMICKVVLTRLEDMSLWSQADQKSSGRQQKKCHSGRRLRRHSKEILRGDVKSLLKLCRPVSVVLQRLSSLQIEAAIGAIRKGKSIVNKSGSKEGAIEATRTEGAIRNGKSIVNESGSEEGSNQSVWAIEAIGAEVSVVDDVSIGHPPQVSNGEEGWERAVEGGSAVPSEESSLDARACCPARVHRDANDAKRRENPAHEDVDYHDRYHRGRVCSCCCVHLAAPPDARALRRLEQRLRVTLAGARRQKPEELEAEGKPRPRNQRKRRRSPARPTLPNPPSPPKSPDTLENPEEASLREWLRQKTINERFFYLTPPNGKPSKRSKPAPPPPPANDKPAQNDSPAPSDVIDLCNDDEDIAPQKTKSRKRTRRPYTIKIIPPKDTQAGTNVQTAPNNTQSKQFITIEVPNKDSQPPPLSTIQMPSNDTQTNPYNIQMVPNITPLTTNVQMAPNPVQTPFTTVQLPPQLTQGVYSPVQIPVNSLDTQPVEDGVMNTPYTLLGTSPAQQGLALSQIPPQVTQSHLGITPDQNTQNTQNVILGNQSQGGQTANFYMVYPQTQPDGDQRRTMVILPVSICINPPQIVNQASPTNVATTPTNLVQTNPANVTQPNPANVTQTTSNNVIQLNPTNLNQPNPSNLAETTQKPLIVKLMRPRAQEGSARPKGSESQEQNHRSMLKGNTRAEDGKLLKILTKIDTPRKLTLMTGDVLTFDDLYGDLTRGDDASASMPQMPTISSVVSLAPGAPRAPSSIPFDAPSMFPSGSRRASELPRAPPYALLRVAAGVPVWTLPTGEIIVTHAALECRDAMYFMIDRQLADGIEPCRVTLDDENAPPTSTAANQTTPPVNQTTPTEGEGTPAANQTTPTDSQGGQATPTECGGGQATPPTSTCSEQAPPTPSVAPRIKVKSFAKMCMDDEARQGPALVVLAQRLFRRAACGGQPEYVKVVTAVRDAGAAALLARWGSLLAYCRRRDALAPLRADHMRLACDQEHVALQLRDSFNDILRAHPNAPPLWQLDTPSLGRGMRYDCVVNSHRPSDYTGI